MRGKVSGFVILVCAKRITPAYAGKSSGTVRGTLRSRDHPRLCGEKLLRLKLPDGFQGSPPPMRGKVFSQHRKYNSNRITPAYAGKSAVVELLLITRQDHPRLCGEKPFSQDIFPPVPGSPPPMRGKVTVNPDGSVTHGITPAYAGKSLFCFCNICIG